MTVARLGSGLLVLGLAIACTQGERLQLRGIQLNRWDLGLAHMGPIVGTRTSDDLPGGPHEIMGKTATGKFVVLNLSTPPLDSSSPGRGG